MTIAKKSVANEIKFAKQGKKSAVQAAVEIEKFHQAFSGFSGTEAYFAQRWEELEQQSGENALQAQAKQEIANALQSETAEPSESPTAEVQPRTWKSNNGKFSVEATLIGVDGDQVRLKTKEKEIKVPLQMLSEADQQYLKSK